MRVRGLTPKTTRVLTLIGAIALTYFVAQITIDGSTSGMSFQSKSSKF